MSRHIRLLTLLLSLVVTTTACSLLPGDDVEPLTVTATFDRTANLFVGSEVRVLGLQVGKVTAIEALGDVVEVEMAIDGDREYPADINARLLPVSLLGERLVQLDPPYTGGPTLEDGASIPLEQTAIPAEVDEVLRSFENFLASLDANALAELIDVLADTLDGNGAGLNDLVDSGSDTIRVLADSSVDLNALVDELAGLNETLATREERIGSMLANTSQVLRNLQEDRDLLIGALTELTRATTELEPIVFEHADPLVGDLEVLATALSTVDRNLERVGDAYYGAQLLWNSAGRAIEYEDARLPLDNEAEYLSEFVTERVADRVVGLCLRLDLADCSELEDLVGELPPLCLPGVCAEGQTPLPEGLGQLFAQVSPETQAAFADQVEAEQAAQAQQAEPAPPPPALPQVDPRLHGRGSTPGDDQPPPPEQDAGGDDGDDDLIDVPDVGGDE